MKDIATPKRTKEILDKYKFTFKKSLGQNFLIDANVIREVLHKADVTKNTGIIEVGPGIGSLTEQLAKVAKRVVAFEIDQRLIPVLADTLSPYDNVTVIHKDVLEANIEETISKHLSDCDEVVVVANLPYYITTPILMNFLEKTTSISRYYTMMQKEVGERLSATPGSKSYGSLSIAISYYTDAKVVQNVPRTVFMPPPNVDSIIVELKTRKEKLIEVDDEKLFFKLTRGAFIQRRKTIVNNYQSLFVEGKKKKAEITEMIEKAGIDPRRRGESLSIEEYKQIYDAFKKSALEMA
ncbi:16S rRNA (adenine(1518)-N(6)/adenine(1519)-N(6))-dimethyltransferase RsmA [Phocicoccus pinnipedialis]|uniref:Ribosomal RNA small subunit methyltransferase A n=1 Tax=Phocicoccus pinnipedialis TaxID=110845 RepID=A0A6V7R3N2_9BACL|nr:16S rRNA (adenine(1518)-N(6)/adenine(1519)-N(6))-dimethyltransferase RsmA [Jeotgalicoccus pinnipedialis]MBP1940112.1 16S rRNA (adenine1518-N6/adenine1519-N6)-dimethyltransferase [Jeotgalicoccus pinnipedialis]CAD2071940.1 Ribosomal RNA small subunit methyltransferase A [Jeotgalicoccus pinnipedialis]